MLARAYLRVRGTAARKPTGGLVTARLESLEIESALPRDWPSAYLDFKADWCGTEASKALARATAWGAALAHVDQKRRKGSRAVRSTYGFARVRGKVRLAVIRYLPPFTFPDFEERQPVRIGPHAFPVVLRPWIASAHNASGGNAKGSCWVTFVGESGRRRGLLTALHAFNPADPSRGEPVEVNAHRDEPGGTLHARSPVMDAALVDVADDDGSTNSLAISSVVGYKPVRLLGREGHVDTDVIEFSGVAAATIPGAPNQEPAAPVILFFGRRLRPGDSGCLVLDLEPAMFGNEPAPYALYQGRMNLRLASDAGYGLLIEQARRIWGFSVSSKCQIRSETQ
jgi:hypothetical protein